jgi:hypothetical protein
MTTLKLWDVLCTCGFQSAAKRARVEAEGIADKHGRKQDAQPHTPTIRELTAQLDDKGRCVPPVIVT